MLFHVGQAAATRAFSIRPDGSDRVPLPTHAPRYATSNPLWAISRDGSTVAFNDNWPPYAIHVLRADGTDLRTPIARSGAWSRPALSPDGKLVAFTQDETLWVVGSDGRRRRRLGTGFAPEWSPDGKALALVAQGSLVVRPLLGRRRVVARGLGLVLGVSWSPDGRSIVYATSAHGLSLFVVGTNGEGRQRVAVGTRTFAWSPDGRRLACTVSDATHDVADVAVVGVGGNDFHRLHLKLALPDDPTLVWSPGGRRLYLPGSVGSDRGNIWSVGAAGRDLRRVTSFGTDDDVIGLTRLAPAR